MNNTPTAQNRISFYIIDLMKHKEKHIFHNFFKQRLQPYHEYRKQRSGPSFPNEHLKCHRDGSGLCRWEKDKLRAWFASVSLI